MTDKELLDAYTKLNNSFSKTFVFHVGVNAGFFSEFNNMILAMLYCLKHKIKFMLYSDDANFKIKNGYTDIFELFCLELHDERMSRLNFRWYDETNRCLKKEVNDLKRELNVDYFTQDLWKKFCNNFTQFNYYNIPELEIKGFTQVAAYQLLRFVWKFNSEILNKIEDRTASIKDSLNELYTGFHIRGGDKVIEANLIAGENYIEKAIKDNSPKTAFILTDDYRIFESVSNKYSDWTFYTLCGQNERGYFHEEYMKLTESQKFDQLINLISSVELLSKSQRFYGSYTSNPGMFLGMRMKKGSMVGIDRRNWITRW